MVVSSGVVHHYLSFCSTRCHHGICRFISRPLIVELIKVHSSIKAN